VCGRFRRAHRPGRLPARRRFDGFERRDRHRALLAHRGVERELHRDEDQVGGDERRVFGSGDADRGVEDCRLAAPARP
jgi:hypothetical protein